MDEMRKAQDSAVEHSADSQRRQWHAPQFFVAGLASTLASTHAFTDGGAGSNTQS
jgi:hypothetical protein